MTNDIGAIVGLNNGLWCSGRANHVRRRPDRRKQSLTLFDACEKIDAQAF